SFSLSGKEWNIPGYILWSCIIYTIIWLTITQLIGSPLRKSNMDKQRNEADYRTALITRKQQGDAIAGQRGEMSDRH
ncbi:ABC transporter ATP-binding protein/permease, partial [Proteus mirabilis]